MIFTSPPAAVLFAKLNHPNLLQGVQTLTMRGVGINRGTLCRAPSERLFVNTRMLINKMGALRFQLGNLIVYIFDFLFDIIVMFLQDLFSFRHI